MPDESLTHIVTPAEPTPAPPPILLPEHAGGPRLSLQHFSGVATLVLIFFASASITLAYLSAGGEIASAESQTAAAAETVSANDPLASVSLIAEGAYVFDLTTNRVLYAKNPDAQFALASLVKVPLVLAISEVLEPTAEITVPPHTTPDGAGIRIPSGLRFEARGPPHFHPLPSSKQRASTPTET